MFLGNHPKCLQNFILIIYSGPNFIFLVNFLFFYQVRAPHRNLATHVLLTRAINRIKVKVKVRYAIQCGNGINNFM